MTRDEIIKMAMDAGLYSGNPRTPGTENLIVNRLQRFAALVAAATREECAALHGHPDVLAPVGNSAWGEAHQEGWINGTAAYRDAIRDMNEKGTA